MGVARDSPRSYISRAVEDLNDINQILSSDPENIPDQDATERIKKKKRSKHSCRRIYECKKSNDLFLKELSNELGIDTDLQDLLPIHDSPLSQLFDNADKMKIWLVFINSSEEEQSQQLESRPKKEEVNCRYKKISKSLRSELPNVPVSHIKWFEKEIYSSLTTLGSEGVIVLCPRTRTERIAITAVSQYGRLRTVGHLPIDVLEVEWRHQKFRPPSIMLSDILLTNGPAKLVTS